MHQAFADILREAAPSVFPEDFGFECNVGWVPILYSTGKRLEALNQRHFYTKDYSPVVATQVKEKFGTLRFYFVGGNDEVDDIIEEAELASSVTCEDCGQLGVLRPGGWVRTLCDYCYKPRTK